ASENTATVSIPSSLQAQMTRTAISPRLAMRIFLNRTDGKQSLTVLHGLSAYDELTFDYARSLRFDLVHQLHRFDDAEHLPRLYPFVYAHKRWRARRRTLIECAHDGGLHQDQVGVGTALLFLLGSFDCRNGGRGRCGRNRCRSRCHLRCEHDLLGLRKRCPPDAHASVPALHFQFGDPRFRCQIDQLSNLVNCHQWFTLTSVARALAAPDRMETLDRQEFAAPPES